MIQNTARLRCMKCRAVNNVPSDRLNDNPRCGRCKNPLNFPKEPIEVTKANFDLEVLDCSGIVLVDFWAPWCGPCKMVTPIIKEIAHDLAGQLKVVKINTESEKELAMRFGIQSIPQLVLYKNGDKINEIAGAMSKDQLMQWIQSSLR